MRKECVGGPAGIRPLLSGGRRVVVDGHVICEVCGHAVRPIGPDVWVHGRSRRAQSITLQAAKRLESFEQFRSRFPLAASTEEAWRDGMRRLGDYRAALQAASRRRVLDARDNPYLELVTRLLAAPSPMLDLAERRRELASLFSWAIPSEPALQALARHAPLVECGAGMAYWAALLRARGVDTLPYDVAPPGFGARNDYHKSPRRPWTEVQRATAVEGARRHRDRTLVLCWPPFDDDAASYAALRAYRGGVVIHIGESDGATGSVRFHRELRLNWTLTEEVDLPHWPRLRDRVMVYRRNAERRAHAERDRCFECRRFIRTGAIGRCDWCFEQRPTALALRVGKHRVEYPQDVLDAMPAALRKAFEASPNRIR